MFCIFCLSLLTACKITRSIPDGKALVDKIEIQGLENKALKEGALENIRQKPNKKLFFGKFYLRAYNFGYKNQNKKWGRFIMEKVGEAPVVLDSFETEKSVKNLKQYLFNNGYYNASVESSVKHKRKKATVRYIIKMNEPYYINNIDYRIADRRIFKLIESDSSNCLVKAGNVYNAEKLIEERKRISDFLRNKGFYEFSQEYITFAADTAKEGNKVDIFIELRTPKKSIRHEQFYISSLFIEVQNPNGLYKDSDTITKNNISVKLNGYNIQPASIIRQILIRPGNLYSQREFELSYSRLLDLSLFNIIDISFEKDTSAPDKNLLIARINLVPAQRQAYSIEPQFITSEQNNQVIVADQRTFGLANVLSYQNRNFFRGAETFDLKYRFSAETQFNNNDSIRFFNTIQHNITASIFFPKLWLLPKLQQSTKLRNAKTALTANYIYEVNQDFNRNIFALSYNYIFGKDLYSYTITPLEVSYNKTDPRRNFFAFINNPLDSLYYQNLFTPSFITALRGAFIYNDAPLRKDKSFFFARLIAESSGNVLAAANAIGNQNPNSQGYYEVLGVRFAQYAKIDIDIRQTKQLSNDQYFAYRLHTGVAFPYGNSVIIPFERRYFIGGANSIRGWRPRSIGPGSSQTGVNEVLDHSGEIILESSVEYRFDIFRPLLKGALFFDAGNIWTSRYNDISPNASFRASRFLYDLAINTGIGFRFDFEVFIMRFDLGIPLRDPSIKDINKWKFGNNQKALDVFNASILNFGVGYPF